jgi:phosphatidylglycerophosphatase A
MLLDPGHFLALGFGSGMFPRAPGTAGTLAAIPVYYVAQMWGWGVYAGLLLAFLIIGIGLCDRTAEALAVHDHPGIVWDEVVGFLITMLLVPATPVLVFTGFVLFRCKLDQSVGGGLGIMLDDVLAGIFAAVILQAMIATGIFTG